MRIGFISAFSPDDRKSSSGTCFKVAEKLRGIGEVRWIPVKTGRLYRKLDRILTKYYRLRHRNFLFNATNLGGWLSAQSVDRKLIKDCDVLFGYFGSGTLAYIDTCGKPLVYLSDATFPIMVDYYSSFSNLPESNIRQGTELEKRANDKSTAVVYSSNWAADSAINDLGQDPSKVHVVEFGANIDEKDIIDHPFSYDNHLHLLFLGVDWKRKGGDIALDACKWLNDNGIPSTLHIVGGVGADESVRNLPYVDFVGFLDKNKPEEYGRLTGLIRKSHCMLLPTLAECSAIAFAESSANGLPVFTHDTGGVSDYIKNGVNGYMLPLGASGNDFGKLIKECLCDGRLERMSEDAVLVYRNRLNWNKWKERVAQVIASCVNEPGKPLL